MRNATYWPLGVGLIAALALAAPAPCQFQTQPAAQQPASQQNPAASADAAAKPKDAKNTTPPKKVYTNEDLSGLRSGGVSVVGDSKPAARRGPSSANEQKNQQYWHNRAQRLRDQMAEVDRRIAELENPSQNQHAAAGASNGANPPPAPLSAYTLGAHARANSNTPLQRLNERKTRLQQQMDQLEEESRRQKVPPSWLR